MSQLRVVLDTNVLISGIAFPKGIPGRIVSQANSGALQLVLSSHIVDELVRALPRIKHNQRSETEIRKLADSLAQSAEMVKPAVVDMPTLRDPDDLPVLGTFIASKADYLVTGDHDLLALAGQYPILSPAQFWARYGG